jgi:hypothetical protein
MLRQELYMTGGRHNYLHMYRTRHWEGIGRVCIQVLLKFIESSWQRQSLLTLRNSTLVRDQRLSSTVGFLVKERQ